VAHRSVLILDDDPNSQRALESCLRDAGYILSSATTLAAARTSLHTRPPDIVLLDPAADDTRGLSFLAELRADDGTRALPVILLCSEDGAGLRGKALTLGIDDHVPKPLYARHVLARIALHLGDIAGKHGAAAVEARGVVADQGVIALLESLEAARRTCVVALTSRGRLARVFVRAGQVVDAEYGTHRGEHALFRLLGWDSGDYVFCEEEVTRPDRIGVSLAGVRMEALRRRDVAGQLWASLPPRSTLLGVDDAALAAQLEALGDEHYAVLRLFDSGRSIDDVLEHAAGDDLAFLAAIATLLQRHVLVQTGAACGGAGAVQGPVTRDAVAARPTLPAMAVAGQALGASRTWRPAGMLAGTDLPWHGELGVRIGGVQLRRVLAPSATGQGRIGVQNDQVGVNLETGTERGATDAVKTPPAPRDVGTERGGVAVRSEAEPPMPKQSKRKLADSTVTPREGDGAEPGVVISMLKSPRRDGAAVGDGAAADPTSGTSANTEVSAHASGVVDDDDHPDVAGFFDDAPSQESDTPGRRAQAFLDLHDVHDDHHEGRVHHVPGKAWAMAIAAIGAVAIGSFLVYHKLWMPTPAELGSGPVRMPTPEMMQGIEIPLVAVSPARGDSAVPPAETEAAELAEVAPTEIAPTEAAPTEAAPSETPPTEAAPTREVQAAVAPEVTPAVERDERVRGLLEKAAALEFRREAESVYREVLVLAPGTAEAYSGLAMVTLNRGKNREARKHAERALSLRADDGTALIVLGATYTAEGNKAKARAAYQKCATLPGKYAAECKRMLR
jgi:DNA-binding response OmpR family regulator